MALIKMRIYRTSGEVLLAACDSELLGREFSEGDLRLKISVFYDGILVGRDELVRNLRMATIANIVGEEVVGIAVEEGFVDRNCVIKVDGIPHAQMVLM